MWIASPSISDPNSAPSFISSEGCAHAPSDQTTPAGVLSAAVLSLWRRMNSHCRSPRRVTEANCLEQIFKNMRKRGRERFKRWKLWMMLHILHWEREVSLSTNDNQAHIHWMFYFFSFNVGDGIDGRERLLKRQWIYFEQMIRISDHNTGYYNTVTLKYEQRPSSVGGTGSARTEWMGFVQWSLASRIGCGWLPSSNSLSRNKSEKQAFGFCVACPSHLSCP